MNWQRFFNIDKMMYKLLYKYIISIFIKHLGTTDEELIQNRELWYEKTRKQRTLYYININSLLISQINVNK